MDPVQQIICISSGVHIGDHKHFSRRTSAYICLGKLVCDHHMNAMELPSFQDLHGFVAVLSVYNDIKSFSSQKGLNGRSPLRVLYLLDQLCK